MMNVKQLRENIEGLPDDMDVFIRCHSNPCGNISGAEKINKDSYGFFGEKIPCVIIEPDEGLIPLVGREREDAIKKYNKDRARLVAGLEGG